MGLQKTVKSANELYRLVGYRDQRMNGYWCHSGSQQFVCSSVSSVGLLKMLNMSHNVGRLMRELFRWQDKSFWPFKF